MSDSCVNELITYRPMLLAMEAIGWLHMAGKAHPNFLYRHGGQNVEYEYERWHQYEKPPFPWDDLLSWVKTRFNQFSNALPRSMSDFITKHRGRDPGLLGLLQAAHGITSGIEKNLPKNTSGYLEQDATHMWASSAFGHPQRNLLVDRSEILRDHGWLALVDEIRRILCELARLGNSNSASPEQWWEWREKAIGENRFLRRAFSSTLAETRLPNNDVTLWDQSYVTAALFKSAVAGAILEKNRFPWNSEEIKQKTQWRLLTVGIGADHYEARAVRIADWLGARNAIDAFFDSVRRLVEVCVPVGSLLYRDSSTLVFSFPGERYGAENQSSCLGRDCWLRWLRCKIDKLARKHKLETPPHVSLSESTRSLVPIVKEMDSARKILAIPVHRPWEILQSDNQQASSEPVHVCPVCLVRYNGRKEDSPAAQQQDHTPRKDDPCTVCAERRSGRLEAWLQDKLGGDTIWLDEVADINGRIALLTLTLDFEPWLDGRAVDSLRTQSIASWRRFNPTLESKKSKATANPIDRHAPHESLIGYVKKKLENFDKDDPVLCSLQDGYRQEKDWDSFYHKIVEDRADAPSWGEIDDCKKARWIVHQLFCKLPSPGRVYRFWRQAEEFFVSLLRQFREISARDRNRWRARRLLVELNSSITLGSTPIFDGHRGNVPISLLWDKSRKKFITAFNLARLLRADESMDKLKGGTLSLRLEQEGNKSLQVNSVSDEVGCLGVYNPVIPLEVSPLRFRVLVPLEAAPACVDLAIRTWEREFARVWDRLPLRIGVIGFERSLPFQAVIEMARNVEYRLKSGDTETWCVNQLDARDGIVALAFKRPDGAFELRTVPVTLPDGREDVFYPYVAIEGDKVRFPYDFQHPKGQIYRHVKDLEPGDCVRVAPARIVVLFMDSPAKRFERFELRPLSEWHRMNDTWRIISRIAPSNTSLQRLRWALCHSRSLTATTCSNSADENQVRKKFCRDALVNELGVKGATVDTLTEAALDGVLERTLDWHLSALKTKVDGGLDGQ